MASYYVWSAAAGSANGTTWANAYTTLTTAFSGKVAGDVFWIAHDHSESSATALTLASPGTVASPSKVICVNRAGSVPPVSADRRTTAQIATTGNVGITVSLFTHYDGIIFIVGNSTGAPFFTAPGGNSQRIRFDNCSIRLGSTGAGWIVLPQENGTYVELNNTTVSFAAVGQFIEVSGVLKWRSTPSALLGTIPTTLFSTPNGDGAEIECIGVDLSAAGAGKTICGVSLQANAAKYKFIDCKLNASVTKSTVPTAHGATEMDFIRCGSTGVNYNVFRHRITGTLDQETTIVRTGGATDGTTPISWKVITTANSNYSMPFECPPIAIWNDTTGSAKTATVEVHLGRRRWCRTRKYGSTSNISATPHRRKVLLSMTARLTCWRRLPTRHPARQPGAAPPPSSNQR